MTQTHWLVQEEDGSSLVHAQGPDGNDFTLCGLALEGDTGIGAGGFVGKGVYGGHGEAKLTNRRITCPQCIAIIDHCKQIKARKINRTAA